MSSSFLTTQYKSGFIHSYFNDKGKEVFQAQIGQEISNFKTFIGCKRWITKKEKQPKCPNCQMSGYKTIQECSLCN